MKRIFTRLFLSLIFVLVSVGCSSLKSLPTETFSDKYASANATLIAINKATAVAVNSKAISKETGKEILVRTVAAGKVIDYAYSLKDFNAAESLSKIESVITELSDLKILLNNLGVKI